MSFCRHKSKYLVVGIVISIVIVWRFPNSVPSVERTQTSSVDNLQKDIKSALNGNVYKTVAKDMVPNSKDSDNSKDHSDTSMKHSSSVIPVYIVEEHHEVIPYWFKAAKEGTIPTRGNVLVHIDGHPDTVMPNFEQGLPIFHQPTTLRHFKQLMQRNDGFIMSSVYAGLISRMIWIYPSWNKDFDKNSVVTLGFGYAFGRNYEDEFPLCFCQEYVSEPDTLECFHIGESSHDHKIPRTDCKIKQIVIQEEIVDYKAEELSQSGDWVPSTDNVFFDIDEDYYGCQAAFQSLADVKITEKYVDDVLVPVIQSIFCPRDAKSEQAFDKIFYNLLQRLSGDKLKRIKTSDIIQDTMQAITRNNLDADLCGTRNIGTDIKRLIGKLSVLHTKQLQALAELGICLTSTPKETGFDRFNGMKLCDGYNRPNNRSHVFFHTPTLDEINERTKQMESIIRKFPEPKMVTICRSSRDGYVPGQFVAKIETDIIKTLGKVFPNITESSLHYDSELHGGKKGWHKRHADTT